MKSALLGLAATAVIAAVSPAQGQSMTGSAFSASAASEGFRATTSGLSGRRAAGNFHHGFRHCDGQHCRRRGGGDGFGWAYSGYNDYGDYDANRSFDPDKWNDWWHDRPDRAYPAWMKRNQDCARMWYSGDVLTC
jgi:hypothetical protein